MTDASAGADAERRLLLLAATSRDAAIATQIFERAGIPGQACASLKALESELEQGCGGLMLAEEALEDADMESLTGWLQRQPPWSDLPILIVARPGAGSPTLRQAVDTLPNVTVLERPARVAALVSTVRSALRARQRQYDLREQLARLREADRRKNEFLAILAHELRNPLAPVRNAVAILQRPGANVDAPRLHQMMERQIDTIVRLVDDLLEVSRVTRGMIELREEPVDLGRILRQAIETSELLSASDTHRLDIRIPGTEVPVRGDPVRLAQVFSNLLNNAAKYTPEGGVVEVDLSTQGGQAMVCVRDSGIGLAADVLPKVFELFMQVRDPLRTSHGGLGIGLTLVKELVEMHGGSVDVYSQGRGQGTSFTVRLPRMERPAAPRSNVDAIPAAGLKACRVVIVDDNRDAADSLGMVLETLGIQSAVAYSGEAGLARIEAERPHCAIVDIGMPGMDGYELGRRVRHDPRLRDTTLVALTGWGQTIDRLRSQQAGFAHHLVKPVKTDVLLKVLESIGGPGLS